MATRHLDTKVLVLGVLGIWLATAVPSLRAVDGSVQTPVVAATESSLDEAIKEWVRNNLGVPRCLHDFAIGSLGVYETEQQRGLYAVAVVCEGEVYSNAFLWITRSSNGRYNIDRADQN